MQDPYAGYRLEKIGGHLDPYGNAGKLNNELPAFYSVREDGGFIPPPSLLDELIPYSLRVMLPSVKQDLSLLNSIYELKDFKSFPRTLNRVRKLYAFLKSKYSYFHGKALRSIAGVVSDLYLQKEFNIQPLLADITGIFDAITKVEKRLNDFITRSGRVRTSHFSYAFKEFDDIVEEDSVEYGMPDDPMIMPSRQTWSARRTVLYKPTIFHAEISYNYNYWRYQTEHAQLISLLDRFGVNLNPSIIWNAIPWTFVIDWFVGVSQWLDQFKVQFMEPTVNIRRYLWSVKRQRDIRVERRIYANANSLPMMGYVPIPAVRETAYRRTVELPGWASFIGSGLSLKELSLGAALVTARKRRYRGSFKLPTR
jgi:hypothetical protein